MSILSKVEANLPPGFRFHPMDEELVCSYLVKKVTQCNVQLPLLLEVDLNKCEPWDLPETASIGGKEWYFYSQRDRKYATGLRTNRATGSGYWKATGKDRSVLHRGTLVGMRKTLVFYGGRAPKGKKTGWVMHEFRLEGPLVPPKLSSAKEDWVLCRVFCKDGGVIDSKQNRGSGSSGHAETTSSSSLPPLMDPYYSITFGQTYGGSIASHPSNESSSGDREHVPCFSISPQTLTFSRVIAQTTNPSDPSSNKTMSVAAPILGSIPLADDGHTSPPFSCEKKVITAVLNQFLCNMDRNGTVENLCAKDYSSSFGEGGISDESLFSDVALPLPMWYPGNHLCGSSSSWS